VRSALNGIDGVQSVELSAYADVYTVTFRPGVTPDEKTVQELFKGCAYNGRRVVVERDRKAVVDFAVAQPRPVESRWASDCSPTSVYPRMERWLAPRVTVLSGLSPIL